MDDITSLASNAEVLFAVFASLAIFTSGFFVGRKWYRKVAWDWDAHSEEQNERHWYKTGEQHPAYIEAMRKFNERN
jgi:hypothetical protein